MSPSLPPFSDRPRAPPPFTQGRTPAVKNRASILSEMHFRGLKQKALLLSRTQEASRHLETTKAQSRNV